MLPISPLINPYIFIVFPTPFLPTGLFWQDAPLYWIHLPASPPKVLPMYPSLVSQIIKSGRKQSLKHFGKDPEKLIITGTMAHSK